MADYLEQTIESIGEGHRLIAVQDTDVRAYATAFRRKDPQDMDREVVRWSPGVGFHPELWPGVVELPEALDCLQEYQGDGVFLFDCGEVDVGSLETSLRRRVMELADKVDMKPSLVVVLHVAQPISKGLAKDVHWIGETPSASAAPAPSAAPEAGEMEHFLAKIRDDDPTVFDTSECQAFLEQMTPGDMEKVVSSGAYKKSADRVRRLRDHLKARYAQKEYIIECLCAAAVAQVPTVLIGPPGVAKGHMIRAFCEGLGLSSHTAGGDGNGAPKYRQYFEYQLTRFTTPEEIFGPVHVQDLIDRQVYRRVTTGYLPTAQVAFLDEVFKASSAILNTMLAILNERIFYNEGRAERVPLTVVFAASNEPPGDESLAALYDRFPLRIHCPSVDQNRIGDLLERSWEDAFDRQFGGGQAVPRFACANDLRLLHRVMRAMYGGRGVHDVGHPGRGEFRNEFIRAFGSLRKDYSVSDRTIAALLAFVRAKALLDGKEHLTVDELDVFKHVAWDQTGELERLVNSIKKGYRM